MAINVNPGTPLRHVATFNASSNWLSPAGTNLAFVSIHGSSGGGGAGGFNNGDGGSIGGNGGAGLVSGAWVQVIAGATHAVTIGAGGTGGSGTTAGGTGGTGGTGGSTIFDQAFTVVGGNGGNGGSGNSYQNIPGNAGSAGTSSGQTTLTSLAPSNSTIIRTGTISNQNTGGRSGGSRGNLGSARYGTSAAHVAGSVGSSGTIHIYI